MAQGPEDDSDHALLERELRGVRPLAGKKRRVVFDPPAPAAPAAKGASARRGMAQVDRDAERPWALADGVDRRVLNDLRRGEPHPEATLDLHGRTGDAAARAVHAFVTTNRLRGARAVLVISGRGLRSGPDGPVLKRRVFDALVSPPLADAVLAVSTAPPSLGGTGALLVLLRRR